MIALPDNPAPATPADPAPGPATDPPNPLPTLTPSELQVALATLTEPATPPLVHAARLEIHPSEFLQTLALPHVQQWIQAALSAEALQHEIVEGRANVAALEILTQLARDPEAGAIERRRAASAILRSFSRSAPRPPGSPRSPRAPGPSSSGPSTDATPRPPAEAPDHRAWPGSGPRPSNDELHGLSLDEVRALGERRRADAAAFRARYDFSTRDDAAVSVTQILAGADPDNPEAVFRALALVTSGKGLHIEEFVQNHRPIHHAAGAAPIALQHVGHYWYQVSLQPRDSAEPLEIRFEIRRAYRQDHFEIDVFEPCDKPLPWANWIPSRPIPLPDSVPFASPEITPVPAPSTNARHRHAQALDEPDRPP